MDRRSFLKTSSIIMGGLASTTLLNQAIAETKSPLVLDAQHPLLLNFNENSLGMSPKAKDAVVAALPNSFRYPDSARAELITAIGQQYALSDKHVSLGNGSSETIQAAIAMLAAQAQKQNINFQLVTPDPTFNYAELYSIPLGGKITKVPLKKT